MSLSDLRTDLADALSAVNATVYTSVPEAPIPPAVVMIPDSPYLVPNLINKSTLKVQVNLVVSAVVQYTSNAGALEALENLVVDILQLIPNGYVVKSVEKPAITQVGASNLLVSDIILSTYYSQGA